jgi:hypothetical protein
VTGIYDLERRHCDQRSHPFPVGQAAQRRDAEAAKERDMSEQNYPVHGEITGPIVMIGFGSIGRGTLPLIERHFKFDKSRMVVIDPRDDGAEILRQARRQTYPSTCDEGQLQGPAEAASHQWRRTGFLRQSLGRHRLARPDEVLPQAGRALYRHGHRTLARLLLRHLE